MSYFICALAVFRPHILEYIWPSRPVVKRQSGLGQVSMAENPALWGGEGKYSRASHSH